jgi:hypothetical protein
MTRYRIIRRPDQESPYANNFEVEERAPYMSPSGECIATYWQLIAGPFPVLDYAEIYIEKAMEIERDQRFVVKEYDVPTELQSEATKVPVRLRVGDIWEFETEVKERGRMKPRTMQWRVVQWHTGELAWQLQSLDGKHFTYLMEFAPQYEDMKFIGTEKTSM